MKILLILIFACSFNLLSEHGYSQTTFLPIQVFPSPGECKLRIQFPLIEIEGDPCEMQEMKYWCESLPFENPNLPFPEIEIFFGECDPRNTTCTFISYCDPCLNSQSTTVGWSFIFDANDCGTTFCEGDFSHFAMKFPGELGWLVYKNGVLCSSCPMPDCNEENEECEEFIEDCGPTIQGIIGQHLLVNGCEQWGGECSKDDLAYRTGTVGIGVTSEPPTGNPVDVGLLFVRGRILTEKIKISISDDPPYWGSRYAGEKGDVWCDYVFDKDYPLMPLYEVEKFIEQNKHLPNTPSAKEIEKDGGFDVGSVIVNHQEKIEEIFLHLINLKEQVNRIEKGLNNQ